VARIRSIKPDFWTDDALTECSLPARLLFIGTWNFADDAGNLDRSAKQIKARVFPVDNIDCEPLIQELIAHNLLKEYTVDQKKYLHIRGFNKHQVINHPSKPTCPVYEDSGSTTVVLTGEQVMTATGGEGKEGKLNTLSGKPDSCKSKVPQGIKPQAEEVLSFLNEKASRAYRPTDANLELIAARLKEGATVDDLKGVVENRVAAWSCDDKMREFLRPATLFNRTKFSQYSGELGAQSAGTDL
jgi:uncharacterized phage protein (TIGR02220 family)